MKITIGGADYTKYLTLPVTVQTTLNDQLDTAVLTLRAMRRKEPFQPFTPVTFEEDGVSKSFYLAIDDVKELLGRRMYDHAITLIEETKIAERILMESKAFTQPLVRDYADGQSIATYNYISEGTGEIEETGFIADGYLYSPINHSARLVIPLNGKNPAPNDWVILGNILIDSVYGKIIVAYAESYGEPEEILYEQPASTIDLSSSISVNMRYPTGCYVVRIYKGEVAMGTGYGYFYDIPIYVVEKPTSRSEYTIGDVVDILLDVAEPLREGLDSPRYHVAYTDRQLDEVRNAKAPPQLIFSGGRSLGENLREVGRIIHSIPKIEGDRITFEDLGSSLYADLSRGRLFGFSDSYNAAD